MLATEDWATPLRPELRPELAAGAPSSRNSCDRSLRPACGRTRRHETVAWLISLDAYRLRPSCDRDACDRDRATK
eukprot:14597948-Alexandrium_andersonii.AAC.1